MRVIGLTGGIASGKSTVSAYLIEKGIKVIDADKISREVCRIGQPGYNEIIQEFGDRFLAEDRSLDRRELGSLVFSDPVQLEKLEGILHPLITERVKEEIAVSNGTVVIDAALLYKAGLDKLCSEVWLVCADEHSRIKRILERDGLLEEDAVKRIKNQPSDEALKNRADVVILNDGRIADLFLKVDEVLNG